MAGGPIDSPEMRHGRDRTPMERLDRCRTRPCRRACLAR